MMQFIKGNSQNVQNEIDDYLSKIAGRILCRSRRSESAVYPKYNNMATQLYIHICFTGDTWHRIFRITNKESSISIGTIEPGEINLEAMMRDAAQATTELFGDYGFKAVRAVLMSFGNHLADAVGEFAAKFDRTYNENGLEMKVRHNELEILKDVDWIEDLMEESDVQPR